MHDAWIDIGRLWTNGEPFLVVDAALRDAWQGFSNDEFGQIIRLGPQNTSVPVGAGRAVLVGGDGVVRDLLSPVEPPTTERRDRDPSRRASKRFARGWLRTREHDRLGLWMSG
jgi:hypothetical protein